MSDTQAKDAPREDMRLPEEELRRITYQYLIRDSGNATYLRCREDVIKLLKHVASWEDHNSGKGPLPDSIF